MRSIGARPGWKRSLQPDRVKLVLPMVSLIPDEVDQALRVRFGDRFAKLDKTAVQAVVTAQVEGSVTNGRMQEITGEHSKDITGVLQSLVRDGLLTQQNQRRWASYRVTEDSPQSGDDSPHLEADSPQSSPQLGGGGELPPIGPVGCSVASDSRPFAPGRARAQEQETACGPTQGHYSAALRRALVGKV